MANINTYKAYEKMMQDPETRKSYIREKKRRRSASKRKKMPANDPTKLPAGLKKKILLLAHMEMQVEVDQFLSLIKVEKLEAPEQPLEEKVSKAFFNLHPYLN